MRPAPAALGLARLRHVVWVLPVAGAMSLAPLVDRPLVAAWALGVLSALAAARAAVRRLGVAGAWLAALCGSILLGEMGAVALGGQSGRLLWADGWLVLGLGVALLRARALEVPRAPFLIALAPLLAWSALGLLWAPDPLTGLAELKEWIVAALAGAAAVTWASDPARARRLLAAVALTGTLVAVAMAWTALRHPAGLVMAVMFKLVDLSWGRSNYLAGILILSFPISLGLLGHARSAWARAGWGLCLATLYVASGGPVSAVSRRRMLLAAAGTYLFARGATRTPRLVLLVAIAAGVALYVSSPLHDVLTYRLAAGALDYSSGERFALYRLAWDCFLSHPWTGVGLNNFSVAAHALHGLDTVPHNLELGFLAELGLPGLALVVAWVVALGRSCWRCRERACDRHERSLALGLWAAWLAFLVHNQLESTLYGEQFKLLLFLAAAATWRLSESEPAEDRAKRLLRRGPSLSL